MTALDQDLTVEEKYQFEGDLSVTVDDRRLREILVKIHVLVSHVGCSASPPPRMPSTARSAEHPGTGEGPLGRRLAHKHKGPRGPHRLPNHPTTLCLARACEERRRSIDCRHRDTSLGADSLPPQPLPLAVRVPASDDRSPDVFCPCRNNSHDTKARTSGSISWANGHESRLFLGIFPEGQRDDFATGRPAGHSK